jgi:hypothetical protein
MPCGGRICSQNDGTAVEETKYGDRPSATWQEGSGLLCVSLVVRLLRKPAQSLQMRSSLGYLNDSAKSSDPAKFVTDGPDPSLQLMRGDPLILYSNLTAITAERVEAVDETSVLIPKCRTP